MKALFIICSLMWSFTGVAGQDLQNQSTQEATQTADENILPKEAGSETKQALKVAFVLDSYDQLKSGGIISAHRFIQRLRQDIEIKVITTGDIKKDESNRVKIPGFYPPFFKSVMQRNGMIFGRPNKKVLREAFKDVDLVYVHLPFYLSIGAIKIAKEMGKPVVAGFHLQPENLLMNIKIKSKRISDRLYHFFVERFYNQADAVICPSDFAADILNNHPYFTSTTVVISNGISEKFRPQEVTPFEEYKDRFVVLTVGRLAKEKRHDLIIDAVKMAKNSARIQLVITGSGALKEELIKRAEGLNHPAKIGFVSDEDLVRLYNSANLYVHASEVELEGMSVLEAIGSGLPAIISDSKTSASSQFAIDPSLLFEAGNAKDLAAAIDGWAHRKTQLREMGAAYAKSAEKYYFEASSQKMLELFRKVVRRAAARDEKA